TRYALSTPENFEYELKAEVIDSFPNGEGGYTFVIHRFTRPVTGGSWAFLDTWSARKTEKETVVSEENVPYVKLVFPLEAGTTWDGNKRNVQEVDGYVVREIDMPRALDGLAFEKTLVVEMESYDDLVTRADVRSEVFARGVGMIMKQTRQVTYCSDVVCSGDEIIESGLIFQQVIREYGTQ
ncbi:MAG TPA: hypothetical protein VEB86_03620, partial [Chryseosolibacter sp.]|nr:hypothetical protein [Chryseosolibacter sp.]